MTSYNICPPIPSAPEDPQVDYHLSTIQSKRQGLLKLEERYKEKYKKYTKILDRLTWLNACSSELSATTGISSVDTLSTFIGLPVSIPFSGVTTTLTKKYQKKFTKVMKLYDMVTSATPVFETCLSKVLRNGKIDEEEFNVLQTFHLKTLNKLSDVDRKMGAENRNQFEKSLLEEINDIKKLIGTKPS